MDKIVASGRFTFSISILVPLMFAMTQYFGPGRGLDLGNTEYSEHAYRRAHHASPAIAR